MKDIFQLDGYWWLPNKTKNQVFGQLNFTPGDKLNLKLQGVLNAPPDKMFIHPHDFIEPNVIQGSEATKGTDLTLYKCRQIGHSTTMTGLHTTSFMAMALFKGVHFWDDNDVKFETLSVRFSNLEEWAQRQPINTENVEGDGRKRIIRYEHPKPVNAVLDNWKIKVNFYGPNETENSSNKVSLSYEARIDIIPQQEVGFEEFLIIIRRLQNFFSLAMGFPTYPVSITGRSNANKEVMENGNEYLTPIEIYYLVPWWPEEIKEHRFFRMLFTLPTIEENSTQFLQNWMDKFDQIEPAINLYFSVLYNPNSYAEVKYLSLAQAVETFHHRIFGGKYLDDEKYQTNIYEQLVSKIPTDLDEDFKTSLTNRLKYGNEFSLRKRLREIIRSADDILDFSFVTSGKERNFFISKAVDTRNYWTHYSADLESRAAQTGEERLILITRLQLLLEICFLKELGFDAQTIRKLLERSERFKLLKTREKT